MISGLTIARALRRARRVSSSSCRCAAAAAVVETAIVTAIVIAIVTAIPERAVKTCCKRGRQLTAKKYDDVHFFSESAQRLISVYERGRLVHRSSLRSYIKAPEGK